MALAAGALRLAPIQPRLLAAAPAPRPAGGEWLIDELRASGLRGKGGAAFPVWRKWAGVAEHGRGRAVVAVNASEGEPLSAKDRTLLLNQAHLVLDGAALAAESVGASEVFLYLSGDREVRRAVGRALKGRRRDRHVTVVSTPHTYVAGESSAVAQRLSGGPALPRFTPPHVSERGVLGRPTLVQNAETLAHVALIARHGSEWFREAGTEGSPGTTLMTLSGNVRRPGVYEVDLAMTVGDVVAMAGGTGTPATGALLGGYFGSWLPADGLLDVGLDADELAAAGACLGCGVLAVLPEDACGIVESARVLEYLARESAGQCGPCVYGLRALADAAGRLARSQPAYGDRERLARWGELVKGRGACRHPDGAVAQLESALAAFAAHLRFHEAGIRCRGLDAAGFPRPPGVRA